MTPSPPKFRDRLLRDADRYKDGTIGQLELLDRIDTVIDAIAEAAPGADIRALLRQILAVLKHIELRTVHRPSQGR